MWGKPRSFVFFKWVSLAFLPPKSVLSFTMQAQKMIYPMICTFIILSPEMKKRVCSILIRSVFSSYHVLISVSKIRLYPSAVNGAAHIHQSSKKERSSLYKKPPRLPVAETGAVRLRYLRFFKPSRHYLRGFLIAACSALYKQRVQENAHLRYLFFQTFDFSSIS